MDITETVRHLNYLLNIINHEKVDNIEDIKFEYRELKGFFTRWTWSYRATELTWLEFYKDYLRSKNLRDLKI